MNIDSKHCAFPAERMTHGRKELKVMTKKNTEPKTKRRTKVKDIPNPKVLTPAQARKVKGGKGFQIISAGPDGPIVKK